MLSQEFFQSLSEKAAQLFPDTSGVKADVEKRLNQLLQSSFSKLNLVTREEFDAQLVALRRAEDLIADLEKKVTNLETQQK